MRRRMLSGLNITLTLSKSSDSVDYQYGQTTFQVYCNGELLTDSQNVTVASSDTSWLRVSWSYSTGTVTVTHYQNSFKSDRSAYVTVTYNKVVSPQYTVSQTKMPMSTSDILPVFFRDGVIYQYGNWPAWEIKPLAIQVPGLTNTFISIYQLSPGRPDQTQSINYTTCNWGGKGYFVGASSTTNGKSNSATLLAYDNSNSTAWQTASSYPTYGQYSHRPAQMCWRYTAGNRNNGDWYLPSSGELEIVCGNNLARNQVNWTLYNLNFYVAYGEYDELGTNNEILWTSTEKDATYAAYVSVASGVIRGCDKQSGNYQFYVRPFIQP